MTHHDVIIIGGSFAGLSAATYVARGRRSVRVIDAGKPRNRFAKHSHGFFAQDGSSPAAMLKTAKEQVKAYPTVRVTEGKAVNGTGQIDDFSIELDTGEVVSGRRLIFAFGISDVLPDLPGLAERWGKSVIHCPYCHGYELSGKKLAVLNLSPMSSHQAMLISEWGPTTFYLNGGEEPDAATLAELEKRGVTLEAKRVAGIRGGGTSISEIELADGRLLQADALFIGPSNRLNSQIAEQFGCILEDMPLGKAIKTDEMKATSIQGIYAAGDISRGAHSVAWSVADGVSAGVNVHRSLVF